jgi:hypothetical protein
MLAQRASVCRPLKIVDGGKAVDELFVLARVSHFGANQPGVRRTRGEPRRHQYAVSNTG